MLENKINKKEIYLFILIQEKSAVFKRLKKEEILIINYLENLKNVQLPLDYKKKKSQFIIKNDFTKKTVTKYVKYILQQIQKMKEIVLDTETTGLNVKDGHRIVEIGCLELENLIPTKKISLLY